MNKKTVITGLALAVCLLALATGVGYAIAQWASPPMPADTPTVAPPLPTLTDAPEPLEGVVTGLRREAGIDGPFFGIEVTAADGRVYYIDASGSENGAPEGQACVAVPRPANSRGLEGSRVRFLLPYQGAADSFTTCAPDVSKYVFALAR